MSKRALLAVGCAALLGASALATQQPKSSCCARRTTAAASSRLRCSLTGKVVDKCCCVERAGKLHCTLAGKDVASCCCRPVEEKAAQAT